MKRFLLLLLITLSFGQQLSATIHTVCASGCAYSSIVSAIAAASSGDIIDIQDAIHTESGVTISKNLTIQGQGQTSTIVQANATLDNATDRVFKISAGYTVIFKDLTIQNGNKASFGGGIHITCDGTTDITFTNVTIMNNKADGARGGGVYITGNSGTVTFTNCVIDNNTSVGSSGDGGGVVNVGASTFSMIKCTIKNNTAGDDGGGVFIYETGSTNKFINCTIFNNTAGGESGDKGRGGGLSIGAGADHYLYNCTVVANTLTTISERQGSGIYHESSSNLSLVNTIVADNSGATQGNDIYANASGALTQTTSLCEDCENGGGSCPQFTYFGDPNLSSVATCGVHSYFVAATRSFISDNGTAPLGDIPTDDICGNTRSHIKYDIGAYDDLSTSTGLITTKMDIEDYIANIIDFLPSEETNEFSEPTAGNLTTWRTIIDNLLANNTSTANTNATTIDYEVILFTDNSISPYQSYYLLQKTINGSNYWGTYVFNTAPCREIVIQAPHPINDGNTGNQGAYCFKHVNARLFMLAGTHRCNETAFSSCSGTTSTCSATSTAENFRISDMAHNSNNCFQVTSDKIHDDLTNTVIIQLHGFAKEVSDPYVILSNGTTSSPSSTDYTNNFKTALAATDGSLTFKVAHIDSWTRLIGTTNTQGRYINGEITPCTDAASAATGRFIHLEQERTSLRDDSTGWEKVSTAMENLISCTLPVDLIAFTGNKINNQVELYWKTATEIDHYGFEIERSKNGKDWEAIGFEYGKGSATDAHEYYFKDNELLAISYYRLKMIDKKGNFEYSHMISIQDELDLKVDQPMFFPNPVKNELTILNGEGKLMIYNLLGQSLKQIDINSPKVIVNVSELLNGQYLMVFIKENGQSSVFRLVK